MELDDPIDRLSDNPVSSSYRLDTQIGFLLRKATQRHAATFTAKIPDLTPPQLSTMAALHESGPKVQNHLGRIVAMDAATIKGVVQRLNERGLVTMDDDDKDRRRVIISLTDAGANLVRSLLPTAVEISREVLDPLNGRETTTLLKLLRKIT
jgi:DNA-binding MarR family transcriptional regulator